MSNDRYTPIEWQTPHGNLVRGVFDDLNQTLNGVELVNGHSGVIYRPETIEESANVVPAVLLPLEDAMRAMKMGSNAWEEAQALGETIKRYGKYGMNPGVEPYVQRQASYARLAEDMQTLAQSRIDDALCAVDTIAERHEPTLNEVDSGLSHLAQLARPKGSTQIS